MTFQPFKAPPYTQTPNELIDEWLPLLSHVELKVLLVIIRKTFGWHRIRDRISLSQLEKITGAQRQSILKSVKRLIKLGLILKFKTGEKGKEETVYELVVIEDSNNLYQCDQHTPPSVINTPTKETKQNISKKEIYKEKDSPSAQTTRRKATRTATPSKIIFNKETRRFEGITDQDLKAWKEKFPAVKVEYEIAKAAEWAISVDRKNYRKSILKWLSNIQEKHTTPYNPQEVIKKEFTQEDIQKNIDLASQIEKKFDKMKVGGAYSIQASLSKISFAMPNNEGYQVEYEYNHEEFKKKCLPALKRMKLI